MGTNDRSAPASGAAPIGHRLRTIRIRRRLLRIRAPSPSEAPSHNASSSLVVSSLFFALVCPAFLQNSQPPLSAFRPAFFAKIFRLRGHIEVRDATAHAVLLPFLSGLDAFCFSVPALPCRATFASSLRDYWGLRIWRWSAVEVLLSHPSPVSGWGTLISAAHGGKSRSFGFVLHGALRSG